MQALAVIPARGGSKGIPDKNIVPIGGVALIARTVSAVMRCKLVSAVVVSTDSEKIASIARDSGADIVDRPADLAGDKVSSEAAVAHACKVWTEKTGIKYDLILLVQNTNPFHDPGDMEKVINTVRSGEYNSCITAVGTHGYFWVEGSDGFELSFQERARRQDRRLWYEEAGSLYCVRYDSFIADGNLFAPPVGVVEIPSWRGVEIDEPEDIKFAELVCSRYERAGK